MGAVEENFSKRTADGAPPGCITGAFCRAVLPVWKRECSEEFSRMTCTYKLSARILTSRYKDLHVFDSIFDHFPLILLA